MNLSDYRKSLKLTQQEMAERIGVSYSHYSKIEAGIRNPSYNFLVSIKNEFPQLNIDDTFFLNTFN